MGTANIRRIKRLCVRPTWADNDNGAPSICLKYVVACARARYEAHWKGSNTTMVQWMSTLRAMTTNTKRHRLISRRSEVKWTKNDTHKKNRPDSNQSVCDGGRRRSRKLHCGPMAQLGMRLGSCTFPMPVLRFFPWHQQYRSLKSVTDFFLSVCFVRARTPTQI